MLALDVDPSLVNKNVLEFNSIEARSENLSLVPRGPSIGVEVYWSEHGMQDHGKAHLEGQMNDTCIGPMTGRSREERAVA